MYTPYNTGGGGSYVSYFVLDILFLVVRVVGLLFALKMAILGSFWLWTGLAL